MIPKNNTATLATLADLPPRRIMFRVQRRALATEPESGGVREEWSEPKYLEATGADDARRDSAPHFQTPTPGEIHVTGIAFTSYILPPSAK